jgi:hypothetical protein
MYVSSWYLARRPSLSFARSALREGKLDARREALSCSPSLAWLRLASQLSSVGDSERNRSAGWGFICAIAALQEAVRGLSPERMAEGGKNCSRDTARFAAPGIAPGIRGAVFVVVGGLAVAAVVVVVVAGFDSFEPNRLASQSSISSSF